jgi:two-component system sensor histidine kinase BaeS
MADAMQLARAFQNVLSNAVDALDPSGGGCVQIQWAVKGDALEIAVRDNGCGIAAQDLPNLFKPRFTTKSARGGMGIGLYLTRRIIEETHGGTITLANNPDRGAVATIRLPLAQPAA